MTHENTPATAANILSSIRGCLVGGAIGDALGYCVEFSGEQQIFSRFGPAGITAYETDGISAKALISDDTQMTLFTANAVLVAQTVSGRNFKKIISTVTTEAYLDWYFTQGHCFAQKETRSKRCSWLLDVPQLYSRRAPGNTCLSALSYIDQSGELPKNPLMNLPNHSKGCGGVMRVAPLGCLAALTSASAANAAAEVAAITHGHPLGYMPAAVAAYIIHKSIFKRGAATLKDIVLEAKASVCQMFESERESAVLAQLIDDAVSLSENGADDLENIHRLGEGWVGEEALAIALYCALKYQNDFSKAVITAVNHRGDSDSTGAVAGNILGAWCGFAQIDDTWKSDLELYDIILELADDLYHAGAMHSFDIKKDAKWVEKYVNMRRQSET